MTALLELCGIKGKWPCKREWQPTLVFLPGESHGQRSLAVYSPQGCKESDVTKRLMLLYKPLQNTEKSSLCYTVGSYELSILCMVVCICQSHSPSLSDKERQISRYHFYVES